VNVCNGIYLILNKKQSASTFRSFVNTPPVHTLFPSKFCQEIVLRHEFFWHFFSYYCFVWPGANQASTPCKPQPRPHPPAAAIHSITQRAIGALTSFSCFLLAPSIIAVAVAVEAPSPLSARTSRTARHPSNHPTTLVPPLLPSSPTHTHIAHHVSFLPRRRERL